MANLIFHIADFDNERDMITGIVEKNMDGKLDSYLKKFQKNDEEVRVEVTLSRDSKKGEKGNSTVSGKIILTVGGEIFRAERENYEKIEDLINHLFKNLKEQMVKK